MLFSAKCHSVLPPFILKIQLNDTRPNDIQHKSKITNFWHNFILNIFASVVIRVILLPWHWAQCHSADYHASQCHSADYHASQCHSADYHASQCHSAEYRGTIINTPVIFTMEVKNKQVLATNRKKNPKHFYHLLHKNLINKKLFNS